MKYDFLPDLARTTFVLDNYERLYRFFERVWTLDYDYKVAMARRAFNLNYALLVIESGSSSDKEYAEKNWISNTALLLYHEKIAEHYLENRQFPKILILDDICLHGRSIATLLDELERLIIDYLNEKRELNEDEKLSIHWALTAAIDIYVFARNEQYLLLEKAYRDKVHWEEPLPANELRELSLQISRFLQQSAVCNTSYIVSSVAPAFRLNARKWETMSWSYRGGQMQTCFPQYDQLDAENRLISTLRMYFRENEGPSVHMPVSSLVVFGDVEKEDFSRLCEQLAQRLEQDAGLSRISRILQYRHPLLQRPRAQMFSCILSIINFARCWHANSAGAAAAEDPSALFFQLGDMMKIISNFGCAAKLEPEFKSLIQWAFSADEEVLAALYQKTRSAARPLGMFQHASLTPKQIRQCNDAAEKIFYDAGIGAEEEAYSIRFKNSIYQPASMNPGVVFLQEYLDKMQGQDPAGGDRPKLVCALNLMDTGMIAMNMALSDDERFVCCALKAGELSTYVMPRRFYLFLPALARVERNHWKLGLTSSEAVKRFIQTLHADEGLLEYGTLEELKRIGSDFVDQLYRCGQSLQDWDIELLTAEERGSFAAGADGDEPFSIKRYLEAVTYETGRQDAYLKQASDFIRANLST